MSSIEHSVNHRWTDAREAATETYRIIELLGSLLLRIESKFQREPSMLGWAGVGTIVGVQVAEFLYTLRRRDAMQIELSESRSEMRDAWAGWKASSLAGKS